MSNTTVNKTIHEAALELAQYNVESEPAITKIYLFPDEKEIRFVDVDPTTLPSKSVSPFYNGLNNLAEKIQRLAPDLANRGPNPEYPWETPQGAIVAPVEFSFPEINLNTKDAQLNKMLTFIGICFDIAKRELGDA